MDPIRLLTDEAISGRTAPSTSPSVVSTDDDAATKLLFDEAVTPSKFSTDAQVETAPTQPTTSLRKIFSPYLPDSEDENKFLEQSPTETTNLSGTEMYAGTMARAGNPEEIQQAMNKQKAQKAADDEYKKNLPQDLTIKLDKQFGPGQQLDFSKEVEDAKLRADLSQSDRVKEQAMKLRDAGYDVAVVPDSRERPFVVVRKNGEGPWHPVNKSGFTGYDIADQADTVAEGVLGVGGAIATGGAGIVRSVLTQGTLIAAKRAAQDMNERRRGLQMNTPGESLFKAVLSPYVEAGVGEVLGRGIGRGVGAVTGDRSITNMTKEGIKGQAAADAENLMSLTPGQKGGAVLKSIESRLAVLDDAYPDYYKQQDLSLKSAITDKFLNEEAVGAMSDTQLRAVNQAREDEIVSLIKNPPKMSALEAGMTLKESYTEAVKTQDTTINALYDKRDSLADGPVTYDIGKIQEWAESNPGLTFSKPKTLGEQIKSIFSGGKSMYAPEATPSPVVVDSKTGELRALIDTIKKMDPNVEDFNGSASTRQLVNLRARARDLAGEMNDAGKPTPSALLAGDLERQLTETLRNPTGGGEAFAQAGREADDFFQKTMAWRESDLIKPLREQQEIAGLLDRFSQPGNVTATKQLFEQSSPTQQAKLKDAFGASLLAEPEKIAGKLAEYRRFPEQLDTFMDKETQKQYAAVGDSINQLNSRMTKQMLSYEGDLATRADKLLTEDRLPEIQSTIKLGGEGIRLAFRTAIGKRIMGPVDLAEGMTQASAESIDKAITQNARLMDAVLTAEEKASMKNFQQYARSITEKADSGSNLVGKGDIANLVSIKGITNNPAAWLANAIEVGGAGKVSRVMLGPVANHMLFGNGAKKLLNITGIRAMSDVLVNIQAENMRRHEKYDPERLRINSEAMTAMEKAVQPKGIVTYGSQKPAMKAPDKKGVPMSQNKPMTDAQRMALPVNEALPPSI